MPTTMATAAAWKVTHQMVWSARGVVLSGCLYFTLFSLLVTVVPPGLVIEERHELRRMGERLHDSVPALPEALTVALVWVAVAALALPWAWLARWLWRATTEQYRDLFGAHRFVDGTVERVELVGRGSRRRARVHVGGEPWGVPLWLVPTLREGMLVRLRVTRFNALVLDLSVPDEPRP